MLILSFSAFGQVKVAGEMRSIMQRADFSASIKLDTLTQSGLFGLGVVEGLKGEIIILDGKSYVTSIANSNFSTTNKLDTKAAMFVYQNVGSWSKTTGTRAIQNLADLEKYLEEVRTKNKLANTPFAFLIGSAKGKINYHVIDWKDGIDHTMANHKQFAKVGELSSEGVTILGFYSNQHQGVFTHHDTKLHLHVISSDSKIVGHVDQLQIDQFELRIAN